MHNTTCQKGEKDGVVLADNEIIARAAVDSTRLRLVFLIVSIICVVLAITVLPHARFSVFAGFCLIAATLSALGMIVGYGTVHEKIEVSEKFVLVKGIFGKEVYFPVDCITSVGKTHFKTVYISTTFCKMHCMFVLNCDDIVNVVSRLVRERESFDGSKTKE